MRDVFRTTQESPSKSRTILPVSSVRTSKAEVPGQDPSVMGMQELSRFDLGREPPNHSDSHDLFAVLRSASISNIQGIIS